MGNFQFQHSIFFFGLVLWPLVLNLATVPVQVAAEPEMGPFDYLKLATEPAEEQLIDYLKLGAPVLTAPGPFDYFRLALQWPPSVWTRKGAPPQRFTIHGLWPDNYTGSYLRNCAIKKFVPFTNKTLLQRLNTNWPNLKLGSNVAFWRHEWKVHGTCALHWYNQTTYFTLALDLHARYNLVQQLKKSGIVPNNTAKYKVQNIKNSVKALTSKTPDLMCSSRKLQEIRICFKPLSPNSVIDCPKHHSSTTCSGSVTFPKQVTSISY